MSEQSTKPVASGETPTDGGDRGVSKSQRKRDAEALKALGRELVELSGDERAKLALDDELREALRLADRISNKREASRRQLQWIGKLLRQRDVGSIEEALAARRRVKARHGAVMRECETWRTALLREGAPALDRLSERYPRADVVALAELITQAEAGDSPHARGAQRRLFRALADLVGGE